MSAKRTGKTEGPDDEYNVVTSDGAAEEQVDAGEEETKQKGSVKGKKQTKQVSKVSKDSKVSKVSKVNKVSKVSKVSKPKEKSTATGKKTKSTDGSKTAKPKAGAGERKPGTKKMNVKDEKDEDDEEEDGEEKNYRYFKLINERTGKASGRYTGDTPKQAASKGFTKILQKLKAEGKKLPKQSTIYLRESTRNSARKVYGYEARRVRLPEPQTLEIVDKETGERKTIVYKFRNKIKKVQVPEQIGGVTIARTKKAQSKSKKGTGTKKGNASESGKKSKKTESTLPSTTSTKKSTIRKKSDTKKESTLKSVEPKKTVSAKASR